MHTNSSTAIQLPLKLQWRLAKKADVPRIHEIHCEARSGLPIGMVRGDERSHFEQHTGQQGLILCCTANSEHMIAYGVLGIFSDTTTHLADLLGLDSADRARFAILDGVAALKSWRGLNLHQQAIVQRLHHARLAQRSLIGATVAPANTVSLNGMLKAGFAITDYALIYDGLERLILKRDLHAMQFLWRSVTTIKASDAVAHRRALAQGLQGFACCRTQSGEWQVQYGTAESDTARRRVQHSQRADLQSVIA
jgi:hypothetical protein